MLFLAASIVMTWSMEGPMPEHPDQDNVIRRIGEATHEILRITADAESAVTFRALAPGHARIGVSVADRKTMLSLPVQVAVEVVPRRTP